MKETAKNYKDRIKNGDFKKYLHGYGIDIGGGDDCLKLPPDVKGNVYLWDFADGDAQYLHKFKGGGTFDFVYSSHCLEHMRNITTALANWIRVCKVGGILYICVPHETYYEKDTWPSMYNMDHKHSFTLDQKSSLPKNVVITKFLKRFRSYIEILEIRENLKNYDNCCDRFIDQTADEQKMVCAQFEIILRKKKDILTSKKAQRKNNFHCLKDYFLYFLPMRTFLRLPEKLQQNVKNLVKRVRSPYVDKSKDAGKIT